MALLRQLLDRFGCVAGNQANLGLVKEVENLRPICGDFRGFGVNHGSGGIRHLV